jgi:hypothetical protein
MFRKGRFCVIVHMQIKARQSECANAQVGTLRNRLLKLAARVEVSVRRIVVHLPRQFPGLPAWQRIALGAGAQLT